MEVNSSISQSETEYPKKRTIKKKIFDSYTDDISDSDDELPEPPVVKKKPDKLYSVLTPVLNDQNIPYSTINRTVRTTSPSRIIADSPGSLSSSSSCFNCKKNEGIFKSL